MDKMVGASPILVALVAGIVFVSGGAACQEQSEAIELLEGQRVFAAGHSFFAYVPDVLLDLADRAGVGLRFIRDLEQGKQSLRMDKVNEVLALFGCRLAPVPVEREE